MQVPGNIHISGPLPDSWLAACMADLIPDLQVCLSWRSIVVSFHSLQSSVSCFHVILGLPGPCFPTCMSKAVLTAPLEHSICPYQYSLPSFRMRSRFSMPSRASSSLDLVVTMSCGLTLQICLIIALSSRCNSWGLALSTAKSHWHGALHSAHNSCTHGHVSWKRGGGKKELVAAPWTSFFDLGFTALSRIFHLYRADRSSKVGENRRTRRKTTWPSVSRTWLSHIWPERGWNHSGEKPNGLRVNSLIH